MFRFPAVLIPLLVVLLAACRLLSYVWVPIVSIPPIPLETTQQLTLAQLQSPRNTVTAIEYQRFDPRAVVVAGPGSDGLPGVAGSDDNMNGVVDDRLELGATRSDDVCTVMTADMFAVTPEDGRMVLQQGAFVTFEKETLDEMRPSRAIVFGISDDGSPWSVLVDLSEEWGQGDVGQDDSRADQTE